MSTNQSRLRIPNFGLERGPASVDGEGFGTCGLYFESVYPLVRQVSGVHYATRVMMCAACV